MSINWTIYQCYSARYHQQGHKI